VEFWISIIERSWQFAPAHQPSLATARACITSVPSREGGIHETHRASLGFLLTAAQYTHVAAVIVAPHQAFFLSIFAAF
jgi:hypothetical protein